MKSTNYKIGSIFLRYLLLLVLSINGFYLIYKIFNPLTFYAVYFLLNFFYDVSTLNEIIFLEGFAVELIGACIAGAAYYLLLLLNLSTPGIKIKKRIALIVSSLLVFFLINVLRIFFLSLLLIAGSSFFDLTHKLFWYVGSTIFVVGIWFFQVEFFQIKKIPFYSDLKFLLENSLKNAKKSKTPQEDY